MGSFPRLMSPSDLLFSMGDSEEELYTVQSDSEGSSSSLELGEISPKESISKCRWAGCGCWFQQLALLASHVTQVHATCGQDGLFYCGWDGCSRGDRGFNARYKMLVHVRTHTNEKPHRCFKCDKSFSRAENLKIHSRSHTGERPYACPVPGCGKAYSNSSDRFKHTRTHAVDKPYACKVAGCRKRYTDPSSLRKHVKTNRHLQRCAEQDPRTQTVNNQIYEIEQGNRTPNSVSCDGSENEEKSKEYYINNESAAAEGSTVQCSSAGAAPSFSDWGTTPEYGFFCSWLSLWKYPTPTDQDQDLPLDLTVHRTTART